MPRCSEVFLWPHSTLALRVLASFEARPVRCSAGPALQKQESSSLASIHGKSAPKRGRRSRWAAARRWPTCAPGQCRGRRGGRGERAGNRPHPVLEAAGGRAVVPARQGEKLSDEEMRTLLVIRAGEHDPASRPVPRPGASTCCRKGRRRVRGPANAFHILKPRKADSGPAAPEVRRGPGLRGSAPGPCCPLASTGSRVPGSPPPGGGGGLPAGVGGASGVGASGAHAHNPAPCRALPPGFPSGQSHPMRAWRAGSRLRKGHVGVCQTCFSREVPHARGTQRSRRGLLAPCPASPPPRPGRCPEDRVPAALGPDRCP